MTAALTKVKAALEIPTAVTRSSGVKPSNLTEPEEVGEISNVQNTFNLHIVEDYRARLTVVAVDIVQADSGRHPYEGGRRFHVVFDEQYIFALEIPAIIRSGV